MRRTGGGLDDAGVIESHLQVTEIFGIGIGGDDRHLNAARPLHQRRIGTGGLRIGGGKVGVAVAADDHVDAVHGLGDFLVAQIADMGEQHDLVDAGVGDLLHGFLEVGNLVGEQDAVARRGRFIGIGCENGDDGNLLATEILDDIALELVGDGAVETGQRVAGNHRELERVDELGEFLRTVIEFVIADGHGVETDAVHEFRNRRALVAGVVERALELVTGIEHENVTAGKRRAAGIDGSLHAGDAAEAFVLVLLGGGAGRIELVDRLDARVQIVDVKNVQLVIGKRGARGKAERGNADKREFGDPVHPVLLFVTPRWPRSCLLSIPAVNA